MIGHKSAISQIKARPPDPGSLNTKEEVDHPAHYGGAENPYEVIKVIDAWNLDFYLGNAVKYIGRAERKFNMLQDLKKARWYLDHKIKILEGENEKS